MFPRCIFVEFSEILETDVVGVKNDLNCLGQL